MRFRMSRKVFTCIVRELTDNVSYFQQATDCTGKVGISSLMKCISAIHQLAYDVVLDVLDKDMQIGNKTSHDSLEAFCKVVIKLYGEEYLRRPTNTDVEKLYAFHEEKHGFHGMIRSLDGTDWPSDPSILLEVVASQDLLIWQHLHLAFPFENNVVWRLKSSSGKGLEFAALLRNFGGNELKSNGVKRMDLVRILCDYSNVYCVTRAEESCRYRLDSSTVPHSRAEPQIRSPHLRGSVAYQPFNPICSRHGTELERITVCGNARGDISKPRGLVGLPAHEDFKYEVKLEEENLILGKKFKLPLSRADEETKRLTRIWDELEVLTNPVRKKLATVRKKVDAVNRELRSLEYVAKRR
ncbi:ALP1-like protein [Tanacetum coccineum]